MDPNSITAATLLATALNELVSEAGKSTWAALAGLVSKVRDRLRADEAGRTALESVQRSPNDEALTGELASLIDRLTSTDQQFQADVMNLVTAARQNPATAKFFTIVSGQASVAKMVIIENAGDLNF